MISTQVVLCHGVCLSLIFSRNVGFQVLYVCTNAGLSVAVGRAAGANASDHYLAPLLAWAASVAGGNAFISVWIPNLQPDFNVSVIERFGPDSSAALQELDESNRFVQKSAESTSI